MDEYGRPVDGFALSGPIIPPLVETGRRSGHWPTFLRDLLKANPTCLGCGRKAETGHHEKPFHDFPELELDAGNVLPVCVPCHFVICHAGNWKTYAPHARGDLVRHAAAVRTAAAI